MPQKISPFVEAAYGAPLGESGWNSWMDEDLLKFSYLHDRNIDGVVSSLPVAVNGKAYFNTTDNRVYYVVDGTYYSSSVPKWFEFINRSDGTSLQWNGTAIITLGSLASKANIDSPTFTGTVSGISKAMVGLSNVDNTSDLNKPVSNPQQTALNLKANSDSPTFTGSPTTTSPVVTDNGTRVASTAFVRALTTPSLIQFGAVAGGTLDASSAFTAALLATDNIIVPAGQFKLSVSVTIPKTKTITFLPGASITIDTGVTLTVLGKINAPVARIFFGAGVVAGIRQVYPEWWGALGDGTGDDQPFLTAAHSCILTSGNSLGGRPTIFLTGRNYQINSTWVITPTANIGMEVVGSGVIFSGSRIVAAPTFPAAPVVLINGSTDSTQKIADFIFRDIGIVPSATGRGSATVGLQVGNTASNTNLSGFQWNKIENVFVTAFPTGILVVHARLIEFSRCSVWNDGITGTGNAAIRFKLGGSFTGDLRFNDCQFIANTNAQNMAVSMEATGGAFSSGANQMAGIKFYGCDFYPGDIKVNMVAQNGAYLTDIWFIACQWDGSSNRDVYMEVSNTNSLIDDIHFVDCFMAGGNLSTTAQVTLVSLGNSARIVDIFFNNCILESAVSQSILITDGGFTTTIGGSTVSVIQGVSIDSCTVRDNSFGTGACIQAKASRLMFSNNKANRVTNTSPKYFIQIDSGSVNYIVTSNLGAGIVSTATILDNGGAVNKVVANNL